VNGARQRVELSSIDAALDVDAIYAAAREA
jgi:hypothetical protein